MEEKDTLVIGDFHFGTKTNSVQWLEEMENYFVEIENLIEAAGVQNLSLFQNGNHLSLKYFISILI